MDAPQDIVDRGKPRIIEIPDDRCDAKDCGAKAYVFAQLAPGPVAYCAHHGTEYLPALTVQASVIIDLRHELIP